jgi:hypothetical protein
LLVAAVTQRQMFVSRYMPCPECGASLDGAAEELHACDPERLLDFGLFQLRGELAELEWQVAEYLDSPQGRFAVWDAARRRLGG